jgi:prepilin-type processing-associated H-X9-DG protein
MRFRFLIYVLLCWVALVNSSFAACRNLMFADKSFTACQFDIGKDLLGVYNLDENGQPLASFGNLAGMLEQQGKTLKFAMNAGMFGQDYKAIGLFVEDGKVLHKLNRRNGAGNFHLKPNGVFYIQGQQAGVMETEAFAKSGIKPDFATQSGPMLVIDGNIHPKLSPGGTSEKIRNGVGIVDDHTVEFVISNNAVTFYDFASLFRDQLKCPNALFFDGSVSSLYSSELQRSDGFIPLGPMVAVYQMR